MKFLLDFFPIALFFSAYKLRDIYFATGVLMAATVLQSAALYALDRKLQTLQKATLLLVLVFGTLTLLLHDSLALEDDDRLVLLAGVPDAWFRHPDGLAVDRLPTHFGELSFTYRVAGDRGTLQLTGHAQPPGGFVLRLPKFGKPAIIADGKELPAMPGGDVSLRAGTRCVTLDFRQP